MIEGHSSNFTRFNNNMSEFDFFCSSMLTGPLVLIVCSLPCTFVAIPATLWLLWVLVQRRRSGLFNDTYMVNLTVMDMLYNLIFLPNVLNYLVIRDELISDVFYIFAMLSIVGRPVMMMFICVDCYVAVVWPITYVRVRDKPYRGVACALVWIFTIFVTLIITLKVIALETVTYILYSICLMTIALCDISILHALRKPDPSGKVKVHPQKQRALQVIINSLVMCLVSYLPPMVSHILYQVLLMDKQQLLCHIVIPSYIGPYLGSTIMPVIYLGNLGKLKVCGKRKS